MISFRFTGYDMWTRRPEKKIADNIGLGNFLYQMSTIYSICKKYNIQFNAYYVNKYIEI